MRSPTSSPAQTFNELQPDKQPDLATLFQHVDAGTLNALLNHELPAAELYKLDTRRIMESQWHLIDLDDSTVQFRCVPSAREIYQTLDSLMVPLNTYFSILSVHGLSSGQPPTLPCHFFRYSSHLIKIASQYEWQAVLLYHFAFFARRCNEMLQGRYTGWERVDVDLMEELLVQYRKEPNASYFHCPRVEPPSQCITCSLIDYNALRVGKLESRQNHTLVVHYRSISLVQ